MTKKKTRKGIWKKERAVGRKYSGGDTEAKPKPRARKKYWVGNYHRKKKEVAESWRTNAAFKGKRKKVPRSGIPLTRKSNLRSGTKAKK